jgi:Mg2+/citrate symporter
MIWPVILGGIFIAFCLAYYLDQKRKIRNGKLHERNREKFEQLLDQLKHSDKGSKQ